ncbi:MAG: ring-cleaving dioxygenase [Beijerinckiaceae bacterium]|nr:ring-cleaving dioxygenase [Beijerinckiaceae bacterium]
MQLHGIHHLTAITADARANHRFYTEILGLRLVKKTVNQDDVSAYHLFYADGEATPGTDLTFFEWPVPPERRGTHSITRTGFRVADEASLAYWQARFEAHKVRHGAIHVLDGRASLDFEDHEGQRFRLVVDGGTGEAFPWSKSPVPAEHQIRGLGPIEISVPDITPTERFLTLLYEMRRERSYVRTDGTEVVVFAMGEGGPAAEFHVAIEPGAPTARQGAGGVHHVAFRARDDQEYAYWVDRYKQLGLPSSGPVDRFYFRSLYVREPNGILIEIATDGPGFATDEPKESMGETLSLPPFLEKKRAEIERNLKPIGA